MFAVRFNQVADRPGAADYRTGIENGQHQQRGTSMTKEPMHRRTGLIATGCCAALLIQGCQTTDSRTASAEDLWKKEVSACATKHGSKEQLTERVMCINDAAIRYNTAIQYPHMDLIHLENAYFLTLAEKLKNGDIGEDQYHFKATRFKKNLEMECRRREDDARTESGVDSLQQATPTTAAADTSLWETLRPGNIPFSCHLTDADEWVCR